MDPSTNSGNKFLHTSKNIYQNLSLEDLAKYSEKNIGFVHHYDKTLAVDSGEIKGRLPDDKYIVETKYAKKNVWWSSEGSDNKKLQRSAWSDIRQQVCDDVSTKDLYVVDGYYNHDDKFKIAVRLITTQASAAYFFRLISIPLNQNDEQNFNPQWVIIHSPETEVSNYQELGLNSPKIVATNLKHRESIVCGTLYLAEINKILLSVMSYYLSLNDIGVFYCASSVDSEGSSSMFFGLAGSGKTTLALGYDKSLVTNEAVAWTETRGLYSLDSGLTIKAASFKKEDDKITKALQGDLLIENPYFDDDNEIIFGKKVKPYDNTYLTFPRENFDNVISTGDPNTIIFLTRDIKGVLPRVAKLSKGQAIYYFLSGYTSTSAGVESGLTTSQVEFSSCYAQPFLLLKPTRYASILRQRLKRSDAKIYMVNVGWIDGDYKTGRRVPVDETKKIINYLLNKKENVNFKFERQEYFNFKALTSIYDNNEAFHLNNIWDDKSEYKKQYKALAKEFINNYEQFVGDEFAEKYKKFQPDI